MAVLLRCRLVPLSGIAAAILGFVVGDAWHATLLIAGAICAVLTFAITAAVNVPLNRGLDEASGDTASQLERARRAFEDRWNRGNLARTLTSLGAFVTLLLSTVF